MRFRDAVDLISGSPAVPAAAGAAGVADAAGRASVWADLGCGDGTFTLALAHLLEPGSTIHAVDLNAPLLSRIPAEHDEVRIVTHAADFTVRPWPFEALDGILMANSLHYVSDQLSFIRQCAAALRRAHRFIIVEYDIDTPNRWVPYPLAPPKLAELFTAAGYSAPRMLGSRPSAYQRGHLYAAEIVSSSYFASGQ